MHILAKPCAPSSLSPSQDSTLSKKLEEIEQRLQQSAAESHQRRQMENQKLQEKRLKQLVLEDWRWLEMREISSQLPGNWGNSQAIVWHALNKINVVARVPTAHPEPTGKSKPRGKLGGSSPVQHTAKNPIRFHWKSMSITIWWLIHGSNSNIPIRFTYLLVKSHSIPTNFP